VLALTSTAGTIPVSYSVTMASDIYEGFYLVMEFATDAAFTSITQTIEHTVTADEVGAGVIHLDSGTGNESGLIDPGGTYYARCHWLREDGAISGNSNTVTDTIGGSVAQLQTITGTGKSANVTVSGTPSLTYSLTAGGGAPTQVKADRATSVTKFHIEVTVNSLNATAGLVIGVTDSATSVSGTPTLGNGTTVGASIQLNSAGSAGYYNGGNQGSLSIGGVAVGDVFALEVDTAANTVRFARLRSGSTTWSTARTLTSLIPSGGWWLAVGGLRSSDGATVNFGASAFSITPNTGFNNAYA
jgi:hypothetical protein